jgi:hypothetical protein
MVSCGLMVFSEHDLDGHWFVGIYLLCSHSEIWKRLDLMESGCGVEMGQAEYYLQEKRLYA